MCYEECNPCEVFCNKSGDCGHILEGRCCDIDTMNCQIKVHLKL